MRQHLGAIAIFAFLIGGCASETISQSPPTAFQSTPTRVPLIAGNVSPEFGFPDTTLPTLFVSTDTNLVITMWRRSLRIPIGQITPSAAPLGIVFDRSGDLFVSVGGNEGWIVKYPPPYKNPTVYTKHVPYFPTQLGIGPDGTLYAADIDGNVYAFANGSRSPTLTIPLPTDGVGPSTGQGFAFDSLGNVFISYQSYNDDANDVVKCPPQSANCTRLNLQQYLPGGFGGMADLAIDAKSDVVLAQANPYLLVYKPDPSSPTGYSSSPSRTITLNGSTWPSELAFNAAKTRLFVGDPGAGSVFVLSWPGANVIKTYSVASDLYSIALWPGAPQ